LDIHLPAYSNYGGGGHILKHAYIIFKIKDDLVHAGAEWVDRDVVVDGNLITSRMPDDLPAFLPAIIKALREAG
jgi:putative intracellular protease/amidase